MKLKMTLFFLFAAVFSACTSRQTLEEKAAADAREFNRRYCPTPVINYMRTDSITFNPANHTFTYSYSFCDLLDNEELVALNKDKINNVLTSGIKNSTSMKTYVESGFRFHIVCHSEKSPRTTLFELNL